MWSSGYVPCLWRMWSWILIPHGHTMCLCFSSNSVTFSHDRPRDFAAFDSFGAADRVPSVPWRQELKVSRHRKNPCGGVKGWGRWPSFRPRITTYGHGHLSGGQGVRMVFVLWTVSAVNDPMVLCCAVFGKGCVTVQRTFTNHTTHTLTEKENQR